MGFTKDTVCIVKLRNGLTFKIRRKSGDMIALIEDFYENQYFRNKYLHFDPDLPIIDAGAHIGTFTLLVAKLYKATQIIALEIDPDTYTSLLDNIKLNNIHSVSAKNLGLWKHKGKTDLHFVGNDTLGCSIVKNWNDHSKRVQVTTLLDVMSELKLKSVGLLKVDIEGAEYDVFYSLPVSVFKKIRNIIVEYHLSDQKQESGVALKRFLQSHGFIVKHHDSLPILFATNQ